MGDCELRETETETERKSGGTKFIIHHPAEEEEEPILYYTNHFSLKANYKTTIKDVGIHIRYTNKLFIKSYFKKIYIQVISFSSINLMEHPFFLKKFRLKIITFNQFFIYTPTYTSTNTFPA